ncbi:MAG: hypothetical protein HYY04_07700 [Chloroflexi bacterium]|nr:hypothetical protein [Chloroflexota bacterium]
MIGELLNDGSETRYSVSFTVIFYNSDYTVRSVASGPLDLEMIQPGERVSFYVEEDTAKPRCSSLDPYVLRIEMGSGSSPVAYTHQFDITTTGYPCPYSSFCVDAQIRNTADRPAGGVTVLVMFYYERDPDTLCMSRHGYVSQSPLDPDQTASVTLSYWGYCSRYRVIAEGVAR